MRTTLARVRVMAFEGDTTRSREPVPMPTPASSAPSFANSGSVLWVGVHEARQDNPQNEVNDGWD